MKNLFEWGQDLKKYKRAFDQISSALISDTHQCTPGGHLLWASKELELGDRLLLIRVGGSWVATRVIVSKLNLLLTCAVCDLLESLIYQIPLCKKDKISESSLNCAGMKKNPRVSATQSLSQCRVFSKLSLSSQLDFYQ